MSRTLQRCLPTLLICTAAAAAVAAAVTPTAHGQPPVVTDAASPRFPAFLEPCRHEGAPPDALCGSYEVFEDRDSRHGRRIALSVTVLPSTDPDPAPDPVFYLAGGPGQAISDLAAVIAARDADLRRRRDLVLIDQRGTGGSNPLVCPPGEPDGIDRYLGLPEPVEVIRRCRQQLDAVADLSLYTTPIAVDDLDEVRAALGYEQINLDGGSYGTRVALVYMRRHPERIRSVAMSGVNSVDFQLPLPFARAAQDALDGLFADCAEDSACGAAFPAIADELDVILARLEREPARVEVTNPATGEREIVELTRDVFATRLNLMLFPGHIARQVPLLVHRCHEGDYGPFVELALAFGKAIVDQIYYGMQLSVTCAEDAARITPADIQREVAGTFVGDAWFGNFFEYCAEWKVGALPEGYHEPVHSNIPVLLISGELDPSTPPRFSAAVAQHLPASTRLVVPGAHHIFGGPCLDRIRREFFERASMEGVDVDCVQTIPPTPFGLPDGEP